MNKSYKLNSESSIPLYKQIVKIIGDNVEQGILKSGEKLPSEFELITIFGVSRITVRAAIDELENMGIVKRSRGKGTFVTAQNVRPKTGRE